MDTFPVRLKWEGNPVAIVFRVDKDYYKGPTLLPFMETTQRWLGIDEKADRLLVWVKDGWVYVTSKDIL